MTTTPLLETLESGTPTVSAELRPPRAELNAAAGREAWIDTYQAVQGLTRDNRFVFLTDSAVGHPEENNLRHLVANLGRDAPRERVVPFLTTKHSLQYCLDYADRAHREAFRSIVVLGGDPHVGPPRCVPRSHMLRQRIRLHQPGLSLGGWANPHKDVSAQVGYLLERDVAADFYLTQVVSHHDLYAVERFLREAQKRRLAIPAMFGVFYYRSGRRRTLDALAPFLPVPKAQLLDEFRAGRRPEEICAQTILALRTLGIHHVYVSNLPLARAPEILRRIAN